MQVSTDLTGEFQDRVRGALVTGTPLQLLGRGTKTFLGRTPCGDPLALAGHAGIVSYEPKELVVTARCGTLLAELEAALAEQGQMLPFEPPGFGVDATLGGTIACGLSGPARPYAGSARDLVLGVRVLTGRAEVLRFGGEVMKNVAGYDVSRLMTGAFGTLGILLDISLKVLPIPASVVTRVRACSQSEAIACMARWAARPLPVSATCYEGGRLWVRLSGAAQGVSAAAEVIGGEAVSEADDFWRRQVRDQEHVFFSGETALWRLSLPQSAPDLAITGPQLIEWGGAQRWLRTDQEPAQVRAEISKAGGHATLFRGGDRGGEVFHPLSDALMGLQRNLKRAFDPQGILNPGRMYAGV